ncbi:MAG TPA: MBL fold metallo-hydrolase [Methanocella sp.]|jgi:glyoxylase-like metal-dependent hydrolase (beta-lactamase superfamily II)
MTDLHTPWLNVSQLSKTIWRIEDAGMVSEYLITGDDRALLVDCGWGIGDLAKTVAGLTSLPLTVVNTHGHRDHTSGDYQFGNSIHIHEGDVPLLKKSYDPAARSETLRRFPTETWPSGFSAEAWIHAPVPGYDAFTGPLSFDLGGRVVDVIETPGHTQGSLCLYDRKERLLFAGDNIQAGNVLLMMHESLPLTIYRKSVDKLAAMADNIDKVYPAHGPAPLKPAVLKEMQAGVGKILKGEIRGTPETIYLGSGLAIRFDGCGILYKEDRLR